MYTTEKFTIGIFVKTLINGELLNLMHLYIQSLVCKQCRLIYYYYHTCLPKIVYKQNKK